MQGLINWYLNHFHHLSENNLIALYLFILATIAVVIFVVVAIYESGKHLSKKLVTLDAGKNILFFCFISVMIIILISNYYPHLQNQAFDVICFVFGPVGIFSLGMAIEEGFY